jgi:uncharacterized protein
MSCNYIIAFSGLKEGHHFFDFEINDKFFESFEESEIKNGSLFATVDMEKRATHLDLSIAIKGSVKVCCDRCLDIFAYPLECTNRLLIRFGRSMGEEDPDIISMLPEDHEIDLRQHFYDYINLALPIKRVHPDDEKGLSTCDPEMLRKLKELVVDDEEDNDPGWDEIENLMDNN